MNAEMMVYLTAGVLAFTGGTAAFEAARDALRERSPGALLAGLVLMICSAALLFEVARVLQPAIDIPAAAAEDNGTFVERSDPPRRTACFARWTCTAP